MRKTILILGGGYAGVLCANRIRSSLTENEARRTTVRLVNPTPDFCERIRLHEVAAGTIPTAARPLSTMLHPDVDIVVGEAKQIDPAEKVVDVQSADGAAEIRYDTLVYAIGSGPSVSTPGAGEYAFAISDPSGASDAAAAIGRGAGDQRIVVVGGGFTGVETAAEVAEQHPGASVTLLTGGSVVAPMRDSARRSITRTLRGLGVTVMENCDVKRVERTGILLGSGSRVPFDACLWTASFSVPPLARVSGLATDELGRLRVDEFLRSVDAPDILGAGDAVRLPASVGGHLRMGCAVALPLGGAAADTALAQLRGTPLRPVSVGFLLQCISLGRRSGYVQVVRADDSPRSLHVGGRLGAVVKEAICRMTVSASRKEAVKPGAYWAPRGPKATSEQRLEARAVA